MNWIRNYFLELNLTLHRVSQEFTANLRCFTYFKDHVKLVTGIIFIRFNLLSWGSNFVMRRFKAK